MVLLTAGCVGFNGRSEKDNPEPAGLTEIREKGKLVAVTDFNSTNYFIYKGEPMGFHFELLRSFSDHLGIDIEIVAENDPDEAIKMLHSGKADLLAMGFLVNDKDEKKIIFSEPVDATRQVLVRRKHHDRQPAKDPDIESNQVSTIDDLAGKTIYVQKGSSHAEWVKELSHRTGEKITVYEVPLEPEELISLVESGEIEYTICNENVARVNASYYPDIDVNSVLSPVQDQAWALRKNNSGELLEELNKWISSYKNTMAYAHLYAKYFRNSRSNSIVKSDYYALSTGRVSQWDEIIKTYSDSIDWDWRLLASLICQESRFVPDVMSHAGAYGLMQIMPETGRSMGIDITKSPRNNIKAGIRYISSLHSIFDPKIPDKNERLRFILASYNAGPGHVLDAMKLAEKNGKDPLKWENNVAVWMLKKSDPEYYNDSVVRNGYFRGRESVAFVTEILDRYQHYSNIIQ